MGLALLSILGQTTTGSWGDVRQVLVGVGILIAIVFVGTFVLLMFRKRMMAGSTQDQAGFSTMEEMRAMVARGEMTKEEYEQVRKAMIDKVRQAKEASQNQQAEQSVQPGRETGGNGRSSGTGSTRPR